MIDLGETVLCRDRAKLDRIMDTALRDLANEEAIRHGLQIAAKELLTNIRAYQFRLRDDHGRIYFHIEIEDYAVILTIMDDGFYWCHDHIVEKEGKQELLDHLAQTEAESGRGEAMIAVSCDKFEYAAGGTLRRCTWFR